MSVMNIKILDKWVKTNNINYTVGGGINVTVIWFGGRALTNKYLSKIKSTYKLPITKNLGLRCIPQRFPSN